MNKPIYKYATVWGIVCGTALAYVYLKTLGKDKGLELTKTLLIGGGIGLGLGLGIDLSKGKSVSKNITEDELISMAQKVDANTEDELKSYLSALNNTIDIDDYKKQKFYHVLVGFINAKKDGKWDTKGNIKTKKEVLLNYGIKESDVDVFEDILKNNLTNFASNIIPKGRNVIKGNLEFQTNQ